MLTIEEVFGRSGQGVLRPFRCVGDDGCTYYVKTAAMGRSVPIYEFIAGNIARRFGLPIADFDIVIIPPELAQAALVDDPHELIAGPAFGSKMVPQAQEFNIAHVMLVDAVLRRKILLFDRWIQNGDRVLTAAGGNPNLLWTSLTASVHLIDHNMAFDSSFCLSEFFSLHAFASDRECFVDSNFRRENEAVMESIIASFSSIYAELPDSWIDVGLSLMTDTPSERDMRMVLEQCRSAAFWGVVNV